MVCISVYGMTELGLGTYSPTDNWKTGSVGILYPTTEGQVVEYSSLEQPSRTLIQCIVDCMWAYQLFYLKKIFSRF